jgi:uncharacterized sulfatase
MQEMNRRSFLKISGATGLTAGLPVAAAAEAPQETVPVLPRVPRAKGAGPTQAVILITDATRKDTLNCYKHTGVQTPNLDRLAHSGIRFERAYTTQPVCVPARSAIFTGLYPHSNGCWANSMPLGNTVHTIGQRLHDQGIRCGYIGTGKASPGWDADVWYDQRDYLEELTPEDRVRSRQAATSKDTQLQASFTFAHRCSSRAVEFIEKHRDEDFLLVVSYDEPHDPSIAPEKYRAMYENFKFPASPNLYDTLKNKPAEQRVWAEDSLEEPVKPIVEPDYFGALTFVDSEIGRVLDAVDANAKGAFVMYTSDHGGMLQSHHLYGKGPVMYEEVTNIPFLVRWEGHAPADAVSSVPTSHIDISGTMMELFGFAVPKTLEGGSMMASIKDPQVKSRDKVYMEWGRYEVDHDGFGGFQPIRCICDGRYKFSVHLMTSDELYDLEADPAEMNNLILSEEHAVLRNHLHDEMLAWMDTSRDPFRGYYWARRPWRPDYPVTWEYHNMTRQREDDGYFPRELDYDTGLTMKDATRSKGKGASK